MPPKQISSKLRPEIPTIPYSNSICYDRFIFHFCAGRHIPYLPLWTWTGQQLLPVGEGGDVERLSMWPAQTSEGKGPALPKQHLPLWPIWTGQGGGRVWSRSHPSWRGVPAAGKYSAVSCPPTDFPVMVQTLWITNNEKEKHVVLFVCFLIKTVIWSVLHMEQLCLK